MPQGFYTLEEAAKKLGVSTSALNQMAQRREVRAFADRGTWRFRAEEIDELARRKSQQSDPDIQLPEPPPATPRPKKKSDIKRPAAETRESGGLFPFELEPSPKTGRSSDIFAAENEPVLAPGSDSEVRLVPDGSDISLQVTPPKSGPKSGPPRTPSPGSSRVKASGKISDSDSEVKLVDIAPQPDVVPPRTPRPGKRRDSEVRLQDDPRLIPKDPDSNVRVPDRRGKDPEGSDSTLMIEKLDLDAELDSAEASSLTAPAPSPGGSSPFEISVESEKQPRSRETPSSSEFDLSLKPDSDESSPLSLLDSSSEREAAAGSDSGSDSGLSIAGSDSEVAGSDSSELEAGSSDEDLSFELTIDEEAPRTPRPPAARAKKPASAEDSSSEFELTVASDSDLSDDSNLASSDLKAQLKSKLDAEEADTELETSDFELAVDEDEDEETRRETEVIIEEDADEAAETALGPSALEEMEEPVDDLFVEPGTDDLLVEEEYEEEKVKVVESAPAEWGAWSLLHVPTALVMVVIGFLLFELLRGTFSIHQPTQLGNLLFDQISSFIK